VDTNLCSVHQLEEESILHALWSCPGAQDVWGFGPMCFQKCSLLVDNFAMLFGLLSNRLNQDQLALMAMMVRKIWFRRNVLIF
jgi:hypothetical protein